MAQIEQAELVARLKLDSSQFTRSLTSIKGQLVTALGTVGAIAGLYKLGQTISDVSQKISNLYDKTQSLGVGFSAFQELDFAASRAGVSTEQLQTLLGKMSVTIGQAASGSDKAQQSLARLGLSAEQLTGLSVDQQFLKISQAIAELSSQSEKAVTVKVSC
jgi:hypothetical protein